MVTPSAEARTMSYSSLGVVDLYGLVKHYHSEVALTLLFLVVFFWTLSFIMVKLRAYNALKNIPCDPEQDFLLGHAPKMLKDMGETLDMVNDMMHKNDWKMLKFRYGPGMYQVVVMHPDLSRIVLKSDPKSEELYSPLLPWLGRGLLTANNSTWSQSRRLLAPAFHHDILYPYIKVYTHATEELVELWSKIPEGESFNAFPYISHLTLDIMLRCICSHRSDCQIAESHSQYISAVYGLSKLVVKRTMTFYQFFDLIYYLCPGYWQFKHLCNIVHKFSMDIIKQRREELEETRNVGGGSSKRKYMDFIDILLEAKDQNGKGMTDVEIRSEMDTFIFEGHDTTASSIIWTLYNLSLYPDDQEKCRREVDAIFEMKDHIELKDLKSLVHLKYCIKETLRLFPPVPTNGRVLDSPTELDGHMMPKGTAIVHYIYGVHRHPDFWENPEDFDPLRFTPRRSRGRHSHAFIPFSAGPRNCIGQQFAMNEVNIIISLILRNFELSLDETKLPIKKEFLVILRPKGGLHLKLRRRDI